MIILDKLFQKLGDSHTRVLKGMGLVTLFLIVGKLIAAAKEMAIAYRFGVEETVDVYVYAFVLVSWIPAVAHSVLQSVLVPLLNRVEHKNRKEFVEQLTGFVLVTGISVMLIVSFVLPLLIPAIAGGLSESAQSSIQHSLLLMAPCAVFMFLIALFSAELLSRERHANTMLEVLPPLAILCCVLLWPSQSLSVYPLLVGTLVGTGLQALSLFLISRRADSFSTIRLSLSSPGWTEFWKACSVLLLGAFVLSVVRPFDQYLASSLGEGAVASLSYATRLLAIGLALGTTILARSILPVLSDKSQTVDSKAAIAKRWASIVFAGGIVAGIVGWFLSPLVVSLLYERGAFTSQDTADVASIVRAGLIQMPFLMAGMVLVQLFASVGDYRRIAMSSFYGVSVKVIGGSLLVRLYGVEGIALATGFMYMATFCFFLWSATYRLPRQG